MKPDRLHNNRPSIICKTTFERMKTLPISGKEWFGLFSFIVKAGIIFVCPALLAFHFFLRHTYSMAIDAWGNTHEMVACVTVGYLIACGCLIAMGVVELLWRRRRQACRILHSQVWLFFWQDLFLYQWVQCQDRQ